MAVPIAVNALITVTGLFRRENHRNPGRNLPEALRNVELRQAGRRLVQPLQLEDPSNPMYDIARTAYPDADLVSFAVIPTMGEAEYNPADEQFTYKIPITIHATYSQIVDKQGLINALNAEAQRINTLLMEKPEFRGEQQGPAARYYHGITNKTFTVADDQAGGRRRQRRKTRKGRKANKSRKAHRRG
jgi:hypothetical protein